MNYVAYVKSAVWLAIGCIAIIGAAVWLWDLLAVVAFAVWFVVAAALFVAKVAVATYVFQTLRRRWST